MEFLIVYNFILILFTGGLVVYFFYFLHMYIFFLLGLLQKCRCPLTVVQFLSRSIIILKTLRCTFPTLFSTLRRPQGTAIRNIPGAKLSK